jgi:hypothetical protein
MWGRLGLSIVLGVFFALPSLSSFAIINPDPVGKATLLASNNSGVTGEAIIRRTLQTGESHIMLRVNGLPPGTQPVWRVLTTSLCNAAVGTTLITPSAALTPSSASMTMVSTTVPQTIPTSAVGSPPVGVAVRIYASVDAAGNLGREVACGNVINLPDTGTSHSW